MVIAKKDRQYVRFKDEKTGRTWLSHQIAGLDTVYVNGSYIIATKTHTTFCEIFDVHTGKYIGSREIKNH